MFQLADTDYYNVYGLLLSNIVVALTEDWDEEMVRAIFWEEDVPKILSIPVHVEIGATTQKAFYQ
jgi:hypothetical protein